MSLRSFSGFGAATVSDPSSCFRLRNKPLVSVLGADLHDSPWCEDEVLVGYALSGWSLGEETN
ncbi:hypothetical protein F2Q70_00023075 [Brassica cretica]|uniref:Uncharacterized protein n=2 Tax=Brassica cretica TaxID=69181 RepID=A0A3N6TKV0_BRACR|nr:hypothetical protein F2Q70_00023075 [Brassica cretica]KAF2560001.1 hypothetical protein F2Q68_00017364 [Brassica cretica]KAF3584242.1 hypothetical protein F2Q69_00031220 [Brassica cretica]KAF3611655.1 hypothetical protein DY000_02050078 [Brassica cretica]